MMKYCVIFVLESLKEETRASVLSETNALIMNELKRSDNHFYTVFFVVILLLAFIFLPVVQPADAGSLFDIQGTVGKLVYIFRIFAMMAGCGFIWLLVINRNYEHHVYKSVCGEIDLQLTHGHAVCKVR